MHSRQYLCWTENGAEQRAVWRSLSKAPAPGKTVVVDDRVSADSAFRMASQGTAMLWRGDFPNARQLLQAMTRRVDRRRRKPASSPTDAFHRHRQAQAQRARILGMLLVPFGPDHTIPLLRAPDVWHACSEAYGADAEPGVGPLRELLGAISAHEWHRKGVPVPALEGRVHPRYGVFSPSRSEYVDLVAQLPLPSRRSAFDIGTGTGVLAAVLARRGVGTVVATDDSPRAAECARENLARLAPAQRTQVLETPLFPPGRASLVVCNPPWIPAKPTTPLEHAIYDPEHRMLHGFLNGLAAHLEPGGEGWLVLSDLAERLGLRSRAELLAAFDTAGLRLLDRHDTSPAHPRSADTSDPLHAARAAEVTSLWRLAAD
ncbi:methylase of polypeptide subunit release factors [Haloactinospora alba]|uniref:Methylase of polypeptide subunit release factors n=1 Tax=Haloactinospora alba TaxID=405555 RepID=A0A543NI70_9ACTN|nr:class I SAM-dependent methyltransferase [Haloactinospora alba]TQN31531.1 methylase of polypeptide subunit release factors [Haloactinospora alba]